MQTAKFLCHGLVQGLRSLATLGLVLGVCSAQAQVAGAGSSLVRELMAEAVQQFGPSVGGASYDAIGSSAGQVRLSERLADFAVSDVPQSSIALNQAGLRQVPLAGAAVAVVVNLPELVGKPVKLNGDMLGDIYQGTITRWNHSQIVAANPGVKMPDRAIVPVWRTDGSGQSYIFSSYLARGNSKWRRIISATSNLALNDGKSVNGGQAMLDAVKATPGAVGYDSLGAAQKAGLATAELLNAAGKYVAPNAASVAEALGRAAWSAGNHAADLDGIDGPSIYPLTAVEYVTMPLSIKAGRNSAAPLVRAIVENGDAVVKKNGLVPLPAAAKALLAGLR